MDKTKNGNPIKDLESLNDELLYDDFEYKNYFSHLCNIIPNVALEKLDVITVDNQKIKNEGMVYLFVIDKRIFKIGHTIRSIKKRVGSYNAGKVEHREKGRCSTTNYFVLQSLLKINLLVTVYAYFPNQPEYEVLGEKFTDSFPPSKRAENILIEAFIKKYKKKPIGCTQT